MVIALTSYLIITLRLILLCVHYSHLVFFFRRFAPFLSFFLSFCVPPSRSLCHWVVSLFLYRTFTHLIFCCHSICYFLLHTFKLRAMALHLRTYSEMISLAKPQHREYAQTHSLTKSLSHSRTLVRSYKNEKFEKQSELLLWVFSAYIWKKFGRRKGNPHTDYVTSCFLAYMCKAKA